MNFRQLECFVAVVDEGSFTRAARRIGITQPSLSQHIKSLELELDGAVLDRLPRGVSLTPAGRSLLPEARTAVRAVERGRQGARSALALELGELEIATVLSMAVGVLPRHIGVWHERHPNVAIRLHEFRHREPARGRGRAGRRRLRGRPEARCDAGTARSRRSTWEEFVVVVARSDPLADAAQRQPRRATRPRMGALPPRSRPRRHRRGDLPRRRLPTTRNRPHLAGGRRGAARGRGVGIALVPDNIVLPAVDCAVLRFAPRLIRDIAVYARSDWSSTAAAFVDVLRSNARPRPRKALAIHL